MGEKKTKNNFKAVFSWLTKEEVVDEILSGGYGIGDRLPDKHNVSENIEKKKKQVIEKAESVAANYVREKISAREEKDSFITYVQSDGYLEDGDKYHIKSLFHNNTWLSKRGFFTDDRFKSLCESTFESYVTKKYIGKTALEIRYSLEERLSMLSTSVSGQNVIKKLEEIERVMLLQDNGIIGDDIHCLGSDRDEKLLAGG